MDSLHGADNARSGNHLPHHPLTLQRCNSRVHKPTGFQAGQLSIKHLVMQRRQLLRLAFNATRNTFKTVH